MSVYNTASRWDRAVAKSQQTTPVERFNVGDVLQVVQGDRAGSPVTVERLMEDGYGVAFADGFRTWIDARHVTR
jgi:hypothetical protein